MYMVSGKPNMYEPSNGFAPAETTEPYSDLVAGASADAPSASSITIRRSPSRNCSCFARPKVVSATRSTSEKRTVRGRPPALFLTSALRTIIRSESNAHCAFVNLARVSPGRTWANAHPLASEMAERATPARAANESMSTGGTEAQLVNRSKAKRGIGDRIEFGS